MNKYFKHINYTAEDIAARKYEAWDLIRPIRSITALLLCTALASTLVLTPVCAVDTENNPVIHKDPAEEICALTDYLHGKAALTPEAVQNADLNNDGEIDIFDLGLLKRKMLLEMSGAVELTPTVQKNVTLAVEPLLWNNVCLPAEAFASVQTYVIHDPEELQKAMEGLQEAVQRSLQNTYSEAFFKDNVLILHYGCQNYEPYTTEIADISYQDGILTVTAEPKTSETGAKRGIEIWQIAVPRSQYNGNGVKWAAKDTEYIHAGYASWSMFAGVMDPKDGFADTLGKDGTVIRDFASLKELSEKLFGETGSHALQVKYPESFFENKAVWFSYTENAQTSHSMWQTRKVGDTVYADIRVSESFGDVIDYYLHGVSFDKNLEAEHFKLHQVTIPVYPGLTGKTAYFDSLRCQSSLLVNTYSFGDEHEITFYWTHNIGIVQYAAREKIASFAVSEDCSDFSQPIDTEEVDPGPTVTPYEFPGAVMKNDKEGYALIMGANEMTIRFLKSKATGEEESITVPYPKN